MSQAVHRNDVVEEAESDEFGMDCEVAHGLRVLHPSERIEADVEVGVLAVRGDDIVHAQRAKLLAPHPRVVRQHRAEIGSSMEQLGTGGMDVVPVATPREDRQREERRKRRARQRRTLVAAPLLLAGAELGKGDPGVDDHARLSGTDEGLSEEGEVPIAGTGGEAALAGLLRLTDLAQLADRTVLVLRALPDAREQPTQEAVEGITMRLPEPGEVGQPVLFAQEAAEERKDELGLPTGFVVPISILTLLRDEPPTDRLDSDNGC